MLPAPVAIVAIVVASILPGWLLLRLLSGNEEFEGDFVERLTAGLGLGVLIMGWLALLLAEFGRFSLGRLALLWLLSSLVLALAHLLRHPPRNAETAFLTVSHPQGEAMQSHRPAPAWEHAALGLWLLAAVWLFFRPHEFILGAADAGVYVNLGASIARSGGIVIQDETLAAMDPALYPALLRALPPSEPTPYYLLPGFFVPAEAAGQVIPQFFALHPVWQAVAYSLGGLRPELLITGLWALLGSVAVYVAARQIAGRGVALLALAGLTVNALQVWFARYPTTEMLTQYLLWLSLGSLGAWLAGRRPQGLWAFLAGAALGQLFLVRIDTYFLLAIPVCVGLWRRRHGRWRKTDLLYFTPVVLLALHSLLHGVWLSEPYFTAIFAYGWRLISRYWLLAVGAVVVVLVGTLPARLGRMGRSRLAAYHRPLLLGLTAIIILLAGYGWFVRPGMAAAANWSDWYSGGRIPSLDHENLVRLGWYLSPFGVWLGVAGICLWLWRPNRQLMPILGVGLLFSLLYLWRIQANPHQVYAMRRYVPAVLPFFMMAAAGFLGWLMAQRQAVARIAGVGLALLWLGGLGWLARGFVSQVDYDGLSAQVAQLNGRLAANAVILFNDRAPIGQGDILGTPLHFLHGHDVFTLRDPAALDQARFAQLLGQWQGQGRAIYWFGSEDGHDWPLPDWQLSEKEPYAVTSTNLEWSYTHRPAALETRSWSGTIYWVEATP